MSNNVHTCCEDTLMSLAGHCQRALGMECFHFRVHIVSNHTPSALAAGSVINHSGIECRNFSINIISHDEGSVGEIASSII